MNFKVGNKIKLRYFKNEEEYNKMNNTESAYSFNAYKTWLYNRYYNKVFKLQKEIHGMWKIMDNTEYVFDFQIEKINDFKTKIKFIKELL